MEEVDLPPQNRKTCVLIVHCWHRKRSPSSTLGAGGSCRFIGPAFFYSFCFFESVLKTFNKEFGATEKSEVRNPQKPQRTANALNSWLYSLSLSNITVALILPYALGLDFSFLELILSSQQFPWIRCQRIDAAIIDSFVNLDQDLSEIVKKIGKCEASLWVIKTSLS